MTKKRYNPKNVYNSEGRRIATIKSRDDEAIEASVAILVMGYAIIYLPVILVGAFSYMMLNYFKIHTLLCFISFCTSIYLGHRFIVMNQTLQKTYFIISALISGSIISYGLYLWLDDVLWPLAVGAFITYWLFRLVMALGEASFGIDRSNDKVEAFMTKFRGEN